MPKRSGRKSLSQTKAPKSDRIYGSKVNPKGSASSEKSASAIKLDAKTIASLSEKLKEFKSKHPNKDNVTLNDLKAVYRRGLGAYSSSHRPTISGGKPNTRNAWAMARVNKFLLKASGGEVKKAYVQDDDLLKYADGGGINDCFEFIQENESILNNGYYLDLNQLSSIIDPYSQIPMGLDFTLITYNSGGQNNLDVINTINPIECVNALYDFLNINKSHLYALVNYYIDNAKRITDINQIETKNVVIIDRDRIVCENLHQYDGGGNIDKLIEDGVVELNMYSTTNDHSKEYGFDAQKPLYIQSIIVSEQHRGKGIGTDVMKYIVDYATTNGHDVIFGHITQKAEPSVDVIKSMLMKSGFKTIEGNNDFYKVMSEAQNEYANGGEITNACIEEVVNIINSIQKVKDFYIYDGKLIIVLEDELMVYSVEMMNYHLQQFTECHDIIEPEVNLNYGENYKSIFLNLKVNNAMIGQFKYGGETDKYEISDYWDTETFGGGGEVKTKKIITDKIGWSEEVADYLINLSPKLAIWIADSTMKDFLEWSNRQHIFTDAKKTAKEWNSNSYSIAYSSDIRLVLDWLQHPFTPKQNLREINWKEAIEKANQFHNELKAIGGDVDYVEPEENTILIRYPKDANEVEYYWVEIPKQFCSLESKRMGHCGRTGSGDSLISLRSIRPYGKGHTINDSHVTIAYDGKNAIFYQTKGKNNAKPSEKYFPYIFDLIKTLAKEDRYAKIEGIKNQQDNLIAKRRDLEDMMDVIRQDIDDIRRRRYKLQDAQMKTRKNSEYNEIKMALEMLYVEEDELSDKYGSIKVDRDYQTTMLEKGDDLIAEIRDKYRYGFGGFGSEYSSKADYGWDDMTKEQIEELYKINPELFKGFGGELILYTKGLSDKKPNTKFRLARDLDYLEDFFVFDRRTDPRYIQKIISGEEWGSNSYRRDNNEILKYWLDDLDSKSVEIIEEKISEITGLPKEEVHEDGIEYYLNGDYNEEHDKDFDFDEIFDRINRSIISAEDSGYIDFRYKEIKEELAKIGQVIELDETNVVWEVDILDYLSMNQLSQLSKQYDSDDLAYIFTEGLEQDEIEKPMFKLYDNPNISVDSEVLNEYFHDDDFYEDGGEVGDIIIDGKKASRDDLSKIYQSVWRNDDYAFQLNPHKIEYQGNDEQVIEVIKEYNRMTNPYSYMSGKLKENYMKQVIRDAFSNTPFRKFTNAFRKNIDPYFSAETNRHMGIKFSEHASYVIGDGSYYVNEEQFRNFAKDLKIKVPEREYADGGTTDDNNETYKKWRSLVNMSASELERFYDSQEGKDAGLSSSEAKAQGIDSGRESARWILKMKATPKSEWTPQMWKWAKKQISFISRMSGNKGSLYDDKGRKTRKHTSLLIWGHNPEK